MFVRQLFILLLLSNMLSASLQAQYCTNGGPTTGNDSNIEAVTIIGDNTSIEHTAPCPGVTGVQDSTQLSADVAVGNSYTVDVTFGFCGSRGYDGTGALWVDWNRDEVFSDSELIGTWSGKARATKQFTFVPPANAANGRTRIRVMHKEGTTLPLFACAGFSWGTVIDFELNVSGGICPAPVGPLAYNLQTTSAVLDWTSRGSVSGANVEYGPTGFTPGNGTTISNVTAPYTLLGLHPGTAYDFIVTSNCTVGGQSDASSRGSFVTVCTPIRAPFHESFDAQLDLPTCWEQQATTGTPEWLVGTTGAADYGLASAVDHTSGLGNFAWIDFSSPNAQDIGLVSPTLNIAALVDPSISFWVRSNNIISPGDNNTLTLDVYDGTAWQNAVLSYAGDSSNWVYLSYDLSNLTLTDSLIQFRIVGNVTTTQISSYNDIMIDDIRVDERPNCSAPSNLNLVQATENTLTIDWDTTGTNANAVLLEYGVTGFVIGTGTVIDNITPPYTIQNLQANTPYSVYMQSNCNAGGNSILSSKGFITSCPSYLAGNTRAQAILIPNGALMYSDTGSTATCYTDDIGNVAPDVFYQFVPNTCNGQVSVSLCKSSFDTYLRIVDAAGNTLAFNDESCGKQSQIGNFDIAGHDTLYFVVEGFNTKKGDYIIDVSFNTLPFGVDYSQSTFCENLSTAITPSTIDTLGLGGILRFTAAPMLDIDTLSGTFAPDQSAAGTYTIYAQHTSDSGCVTLDSAEIIIQPLDDANFNYVDAAGDIIDTICTNETATLNLLGLSGGTFSATPSGLNIDPNTGNFTNPTAGNYTITYTTNGDCPTSQDINLVVEVCSGTQTLLSEAHIVAYPNPNRGTFFLENKGATRDLQLRVNNLLGQTLWMHTQTLLQGQSQRIDLQNLAAGQYILQVIDRGQIYSQILHIQP